MHLENLSNPRNLRQKKQVERIAFVGSEKTEVFGLGKFR